MNEFRVEYYIDSEDDRIIRISSLNEKNMEQWKKDMEERALREYYNKKIKIKQKN